MAKTPVIFSSAAASASGSTYTIGAGKYAIVNLFLSGNGGAVEINGIAIKGGSSFEFHTANGIVCPAGTTIKANGAAGSSGVIASGFLYDL
ncbi:hypothetical protein FJ872_19390 [Mesorhizobium sp. B2-5-9]|uniref:hypothetical protein n=1 Tax=Mesorhizobium sp. B2-5-9 TaxID=2589921 RepID=UPI00112C1729|nr:hypothetical protein [Mesorhizobium sp. B2-5-9]TPK15164.1 hypothetical protein FJ872_19390 [Mesorhizobium sp. B2-5-9]